MCNEYNGYKNYQTWNVALWLDNKPDTNEMLYQLANDTGEFEGYGIDIDRADFLKEWVEGYMSELEQVPTTGMFSDLLNHALTNVDYLEIIESHKNRKEA